MVHHGQDTNSKTVRSNSKGSFIEDDDIQELHAWTLMLHELRNANCTSTCMLLDMASSQLELQASAM